MAVLSTLFSKITTSLPLFKISKWDVMVLKGQAPKRRSDEEIKGMYEKATMQGIEALEDWVSGLQDAVAGIFQEPQDKYETIAKFDSFISFNGSKEEQIVQNAIERGSFRSVNKIKKPSTCVIELAKGGYRSEVEACLNALKKVNGSLLICRIVTPFGTMDNMNMTKLDYSYTRDNGSNLLVAKMTFQEIMSGKEKETWTKLTVKNPADTNTASSGNIPPTKGQYER